MVKTDCSNRYIYNIQDVPGASPTIVATLTLITPLGDRLLSTKLLYNLKQTYSIYPQKLIYILLDVQIAYLDCQM